MWLKYLICTIAVYWFSSVSAQQCDQHEQSSNQSFESYIIETCASFDPCVLDSYSGVIGSTVGHISTVYLPQGVIIDWKNIPGVVAVQKAMKINPQLDRAITDMRVDSVYDGFDLESGYTGKDVLIGITDWGFDYGHPNFYDTALSTLRIAGAWDQFKTSGPRPDGFNYGTEYTSRQALLAAQSDTAGLYDYAYHGSHVAGIAAGSGGGTKYRGVAYEAQFLFVSLRLDDAGAIDAFVWMKQQADAAKKRLVVNMSWGLYYLGAMDGTGLLSEAIDELSKQGVIFITSAGNNGGETFHIKKTFESDTMHSGIGFYTYTYPLLWGQSISMWGEPGEIFNVELLVLNDQNEIVYTTPTYTTVENFAYVDTFVVFGSDTVFYNISATDAYDFNNRPTMRLRVRERSNTYKVALRSFADAGTVHYWNVVELTNNAGNWGGTFEDWLPNWFAGDDDYSLGDPASNHSVIAVGAHQSEVRLQNGNVVGGRQANFTSKGPTLDGRRKPEISAPGVNVASSISSYTTRDFTELTSVTFKGRDYPFARLSGTSMASPAVSGVVALMLEANPNLQYLDVQEILRLTARLDANTGDIKDSSDLGWGWGKINAHQAVLLAEKWVSTILVIPITSDVLFPNPATDLVYFGNDENLACEVYTVDGKQVSKATISIRLGLDVSHLVAGSYIIRFPNAEIDPKKLMIIR